MMRQQHLLREKVHHEIKLNFNEYFESVYAIDLLKRTNEFTSVKKISSIIARMMSDNSSIVLDEIKTSPKIMCDLREPYFGSLFASDEQPSAEDVFEKIISTLKGGSQDISCVMQIHCVFIHRIYDVVMKDSTDKKEKSRWVSQLFPKTLFGHQDRGRVEKSQGEPKPTKKLGIANHPVFQKKLAKHDKKHIRALDKFSPDYGASFFKDIAKCAPVVCGVSGHTGSLLLGAKLYGELSADELMEYTLAIFAFLTAGGNHSFCEIMAVANLVGVEWELDYHPASLSL